MPNEQPGQFPFTRGIHPEMYRKRLWTMRQYSGFGTPEETNKRFHYLLSQGLSGLSLAFDLPSQMGYDADHPLASGEVGRVGVSINALPDMAKLFEGIRLDSVTTSMTINSTASVMLACYVLTAKQQGADLRRLSGTVQNDILKEYIARGTHIFPIAPAMRIITDMFAWCGSELPEWNPISISGYHIREAGSTAVQEVAFTLADAIAYVDAAIKAGLSVNAFAPRLSFFWGAHNDFLEEIAKFRAARRLWAFLMRDRFGATDPKAMAMRFHTQTCGSTLTAQQPDGNVVRVAIQALAAVLGGTQSLHTNSRDEALGLPTEDSATLALRTQQIIAHETGVTAHPDPLAGSEVIESRTDAIEREVKAYLERIDSLGGMAAAIERGFVQSEIQDAAYLYQRQIESGERVIVGVNKFQREESMPQAMHIDASLEAAQVARLRELRASRSMSAVQTSLQSLETAARSTSNLMPHIMTACESLATVGEICDCLRGVFGVYAAH